MKPKVGMFTMMAECQSLKIKRYEHIGASIQEYDSEVMYLCDKHVTADIREESEKLELVL